MRCFILRTFTEDEAETCLRCNMQEIVLCKDCEHGEKANDVYFCGKSRGFGIAHEPDWFCYDGKRKDNDGTY